MWDGLFGWTFYFHLLVQREVTVKYTLLSEMSLNGKRQENKHSHGVYCDTEKWVTTRRKKGFNFTPSCRKIKLQSVR